MKLKGYFIIFKELWKWKNFFGSRKSDFKSNIFFVISTLFGRHIVWFIKNWTHLFICVFVINCQFFQMIPSGCVLQSLKLACFITWTMLFEKCFFRYLWLCLARSSRSHENKLLFKVINSYLLRFGWFSDAYIMNLIIKNFV